jgi:hypothetical protein
LQGIAIGWVQKVFNGQNLACFKRTDDIIPTLGFNDGDVRVGTGERKARGKTAATAA